MFRHYLSRMSVVLVASGLIGLCCLSGCGEDQGDDGAGAGGVAGGGTGGGEGEVAGAEIDSEFELAEEEVPEIVEGGSEFEFPGRDKFGSGKSNEYILKLGQKLVEKGYGGHYQVGPSPDWSEADRLNVADFQKAQGWTGADADGYPGPVTWKRLFTPAPIAGEESTPTTDSVTEALYNNARLKSRMVCAFDGYTRISGRHEGIDFRYKLGGPIYSLIDGVVISSVEKAGTKGLSTMAIYDKAANKTVIYLHANPDIKSGATVKKGTRIGTEDARGAGTPAESSFHTHIEVRAGKRTNAAYSVGDKVLDNENPAAYWKSKGYAQY